MRPPEAIGPSMADRPMTGPYTPNALPISSAANRSRMRPNTWGSISAPTSPWPARAAISSPGLVAAAHAADATTNPATPVSSIRLRPNRSPSLPPVSRPTAIASVYAAVIHSMTA